MEEFQQKIVANLITEAEYIVASEVAKVVVWIYKFIDERRVVSSIVDPITIILIKMEPLRKQRNQGLINELDMYYGVTI